MKLKLYQDIVEELLEENAESEIADAICNEAYFALSPLEREKVGEDIRKGTKPSDAYRKAVLSHMDEGAKEDFASVQVGFGFEEVKALDPASYLNDPYYQRVGSSFKGKRVLGSWVMEMKHYEPYECFVYDEVKESSLIPSVTYSPIGFFEKAFPYPALSQGDRVYMSLIPHEMNTMAQAIKKAKGNVCTMGLGMGYFAFMASQKDEVSSLTILERDPNVIKLFKEFFLPLFDHPEKIKILRVEDALEYVSEKPFDYLFADLHHDAVDGLPLYISLLKKEGLSKETDVWIEKAILTYFRRHVIALIEEAVSGYGDEDYKAYSDYSSRLLCSLYFHLKNVVIETEDDLNRLLSDASLKAIVKDLKLVE